MLSEGDCWRRLRTRARKERREATRAKTTPTMPTTSNILPRQTSSATIRPWTTTLAKKRITMRERTMSTSMVTTDWIPCHPPLILKLILLLELQMGILSGHHHQRCHQDGSTQIRQWPSTLCSDSFVPASDFFSFSFVNVLILACPVWKLERHCLGTQEFSWFL